MCKPLATEVSLTQLDLLRALSTEKKDDKLLVASRRLVLSKYETLFTKKGVLKKEVGKAHKGWELKGTDNYMNFLKLCDPDATDRKVKVEFQRRILRHTYIYIYIYINRLLDANRFVNSSMSSSIRQ